MQMVTIYSVYVQKNSKVYIHAFYRTQADAKKGMQKAIEKSTDSYSQFKLWLEPFERTADEAELLVFGLGD